MCFPSIGIGMNLDLSVLEEPDTIRCLFSEKIAVVVQSKENLESILSKEGVHAVRIGHVSKSDHLNINGLILSVLEMRRLWMQTSTALEIEQTLPELAQTRAENIINQPLRFKFPKGFSGALPVTKSKKIKAAVLREKGSNSEREMAYVMDLCGFEVRDVHMTDLVEGEKLWKIFNYWLLLGLF